jgi:hypothetical protein
MMAEQYHVHIPTGKTRQCETCPQIWEVFCHGRKRRCDGCRAAKRAQDDRKRKRAVRAAARRDKELAEDLFARPLADIVNMGYDAARDYLWNQDDWTDDT